MKRRFWLAPVAVFTIAVGMIWNSRTAPESASQTHHTETQSMAKIAAPVNCSSPSPTRHEIIEPILVLREMELAPMPEIVAGPERDIPKNAAVVKLTNTNVARPEAIRESRPWMPYAREDRALADQRRLQWAKLAIRDVGDLRRLGEFEETEEPPLSD